MTASRARMRHRSFFLGFCTRRQFRRHSLECAHEHWARTRHDGFIDALWSVCSQWKRRCFCWAVSLLAKPTSQCCLMLLIVCWMSYVWLEERTNVGKSLVSIHFWCNVVLTACPLVLGYPWTCYSSCDSLTSKLELRGDAYFQDCAEFPQVLLHCVLRFLLIRKILKDAQFGRLVFLIIGTHWLFTLRAVNNLSLAQVLRRFYGAASRGRILGFMQVMVSYSILFSCRFLRVCLAKCSFVCQVV